MPRHRASATLDQQLLEVIRLSSGTVLDTPHISHRLVVAFLVPLSSSSKFLCGSEPATAPALLIDFYVNPMPTVTSFT